MIGTKKMNFMIYFTLQMSLLVLMLSYGIKWVMSMETPETSLWQMTSYLIMFCICFGMGSVLSRFQKKEEELEEVTQSR